MGGRGSFWITFKRKKRFVVFNFKVLKFPIISMEKTFNYFGFYNQGELKP